MYCRSSDYIYSGMTLREVKGHLMLAQKLGRVVVRDVTNMASFYVSSKEILSRVKVRRNSVSITLA